MGKEGGGGKTGNTGGDAAPGQVAVVCLIWAYVHGLLAPGWAKRLFARAEGARPRDGLCRVAYNARSLATVALAAGCFARLSDRELYVARFPWSWLSRARPSPSACCGPRPTGGSP